MARTNTDRSEAKQRSLANLKPWRKGESGNEAGRPLGILNLETRVRNLLEGQHKLPEAIASTIRAAVGDDRQLLDALLIVGALQALQGDEKWAKLLLERGYGKVPDKIVGDPEQPVSHTITLKIDNS